MVVCYRRYGKLVPSEDPNPQGMDRAEIMVVVQVSLHAKGSNCKVFTPGFLEMKRFYAEQELNSLKQKWQEQLVLHRDSEKWKTTM